MYGTEIFSEGHKSCLMVLLGTENFSVPWRTIAWNNIPMHAIYLYSPSLLLQIRIYSSLDSILF